MRNVLCYSSFADPVGYGLNITFTAPSRSKAQEAEYPMSVRAIHDQQMRAAA